MPTLHWIGKDKVINHHQDVPYRILEKQYTYKDGQESDAISDNKIIQDQSQNLGRNTNEIVNLWDAKRN